MRLKRSDIPKTIVFHRNPESFAPKQELFMGPGLLLNVYQRKFAIVMWQSSGITSCHDIDHLMTEIEKRSLEKKDG